MQQLHLEQVLLIVKTIAVYSLIVLVAIQFLTRMKEEQTHVGRSHMVTGMSQNEDVSTT